jgi:hypothetical protein
MSENLKKTGLIVVVVVAIAAAAWGASKFFGGDQMEVQNTVTMPAGYKSEKQRALEAQQQAGAAAQPSGKDVDLGGDLGNR